MTVVDALSSLIFFPSFLLRFRYPNMMSASLAFGPFPIPGLDFCTRRLGLLDLAGGIVSSRFQIWTSRYILRSIEDKKKTDLHDFQGQEILLSSISTGSVIAKTAERSNWRTLHLVVSRCF